MKILFQGDSITDCGRERIKGEPNCSLGPMTMLLVMLAGWINRHLQSEK